MREDPGFTQAISEVVSGLYRLLPATGERSFWAVAERLGLANYWTEVDKARALHKLIEGALQERVFGSLVEAVVLEGIAECRSDGVPVTEDELAKILRATEALGSAVPALRDPHVLRRPPPAPGIRREARADEAAEAERRGRLLRAHTQLFSEVFTDEPDARLPKLANVLGGLAVASEVPILETLEVHDETIRGALRLLGDEFFLDLHWSLDDAEEVLERAAQRVLTPNPRRALVWSVQGFPAGLTLDPDSDRWTVLLDGRDMTLLLEGRWTLQDAVRFKQLEQLSTGEFVPLPLALPLAEKAAPETKASPVARAQPPARETTPADEPAQEGVLTANVGKFDFTLAEEMQAADRDDRRLRRIRYGVIAMIVIGVLIAIFVMRGAQSAQEADLALAEQTVRRAILLRSEALQTLEDRGLGLVFGEEMASQISQLVENLRAQGVYVTGSSQVEILESRLDNGTALIAARETSQPEVRSRSTGEIVQQSPVQRQVVGFVLQKASDGRWRVMQASPIG